MRLRVAILATGAVVIAGLAAAIVLLGLRVLELREARADGEAAIAAARGHVVELLSVDHRTVDRDLGRILSGSTGAAREEYARNAATVRERVTRERSVRIGAVRACGLVSLEGDRARVLAAADGVTTTSAAGPREEFHRWKIDLARVSGRWLVAKIEPVP
ncbi:hypothetical protein [Bailinhaonella thermotolerans]|uniref:Mce-associated membrane protein n=1 Tax=Bailinhaonella thermotolerans TaxID=1070861 RepID=A0A3A4AZW1_9ACTN|nr:hypothetical protein [Bailinhaonella thermotolerans]RJL30750.1 hypothetical protein D5H75_20740 [Bailinhaonella thermotolerans]